MRAWSWVLFASVGLWGCSTPYVPPVMVKGSPEFEGIAHLLSPTRPLDVVLVHGMCTHGEKWATEAMNGILKAMDANLLPEPPQAAIMGVGPGPKIEVRQRVDVVAGSQIRFTAIIWSPLTTPLKQQLLYDMTGSPTDCAKDDECKPVRAKYNGQFKDWLLNDCLADALVYEGVSRPVIRRAMAATLSKVLDGAPPSVPLVLVSDSLGSKVSFDALADMLGEASNADAPTAGVSASARLAQVFMNANQLPILGLADQNVSQPLIELEQVPAPPIDSLQRYLRLRKGTPAVVQLQSETWTQSPQTSRPFSELKLVAFTDPNDLLSYRLRPSRYAAENVPIVDILVSNTKTYLGAVERPDTAHLSYEKNKDVAAYIACGWPKSALCK